MHNYPPTEVGDLGETDNRVILILFGLAFFGLGLGTGYLIWA